ncbi:MAG: hypothetical protein AAGD10_06830 [Myxococcota bacterium]
MKLCFILLGRDLEELPALLRSVFEHPWVSSFQVGFGPPLVRSSRALTEALEHAHSALEKLDAYLAHCVLDRGMVDRLAQMHRRQLVRRHGPIEAEALDKAATDAIDLSLRLRPDETTGFVLPAPPDLGEARIVLRLDDPSGTRWYQASELAEHFTAEVPPGLLVEMRTGVESRARWARWVEDWSRTTGRAAVTDVELIPHAIVRWEPPPP